MSDNLKVARECGGFISYAGLPVDGCVVFEIEQLEAYTSRILASQQAAHDAEIARLKENFDGLKNILHDTQKELSAANAACAMKDEALNVAFMELDPTEHGQNCGCDPDVGYVCPCCIWVSSDEYRLIKKAISANSQQVSEWEAKKLETLRAQVAMLRAAIAYKTDDYFEHIRHMRDVLDNPQATAEQFIAECEQRGAVKALEDLKPMKDKWTLVTGKYWYEHIKLIIAELRANQDKEAVK